MERKAFGIDDLVLFHQKTKNYFLKINKRI
jgi:hypothetical protein